MKCERVYRIFSNMPVLQTERLVLRSMHITDAEDMFSYAKRSDVTRFLLWSPHPSVAYTREYLQYVESRYQLGDFFDWAVVNRECDRMIGTCGFTQIDFKNNNAEIGYVLNPEYHHCGMATEAAREVMRFGFEILGLHRIEAKFMRGNEASLKVMEKLNMKFEGYSRDAMLIKGEYATIGKCAILREEFSNGGALNTEKR